LACAIVKDTGCATEITAVTFDYGQLNRAKELAAAKSVANHYGITDHRIIGLTGVFIPSALTGAKNTNIPETPATAQDSTFVPGRNMVLISAAVAVAQGTGIRLVVTGCNYDDAAGYPDTTTPFMRALNEASEIGYGVKIYNPVIGMTKTEIATLAERLNVPVEQTWSCYRETETPCGACGSCVLNQQAFSAL